MRSELNEMCPELISFLAETFELLVFELSGIQGSTLNFIAHFIGIPTLFNTKYLTLCYVQMHASYCMVLHLCG